MIRLETSTQGSLITAIFLLCIGIPALSFGLYQRYKATPNFVASYRGGTSTALGLPFGGAAVIAMAVFTLTPQPPRILGQILGLVWVASMPIWLSSFLIRFPRFLTPAWYRRALKAGVPRHDPHLMGKFKALPKETQKQLVLLRREHEAAPNETPGTETS